MIEILLILLLVITIASIAIQFLNKSNNTDVKLKTQKHFPLVNKYISSKTIDW